MNDYPFLMEELAEKNPVFEKLRNPILRNSLGRMATIEKAASMGKENPLDLLLFITGRILTVTGKPVETVPPGKAVASEADKPMSDEQRREGLKALIRKLHDGADIGALQQESKNSLGSPGDISPSNQMIERACQENPGPKYISDQSDLGTDLFYLVICFALFNSCPSVDEQSDLASLISNHTHKYSLLYISDYETEDKPHYRERYEQRKLNTYGCFESSTAIYRHHLPNHFSELFSDWSKINERTVDSRTMNGNEIVIHQYLFLKIR